MKLDAIRHHPPCVGDTAIVTGAVPALARAHNLSIAEDNRTALESPAAMSGPRVGHSAGVCPTRHDACSEATARLNQHEYRVQACALTIEAAAKI